MSKPIEITVTEAKQRLEEIVRDYLPSWQGGAAVLALEAINGLQQQLAAKEAELERVRSALSDAAQSLETISTQAGKYEFMSDFIETRGYAHSRARAARDALASPSADAVQPAPATEQKPADWLVKKFDDFSNGWDAAMKMRKQPAPVAQSEQAVPVAWVHEKVFAKGIGRSDRFEGTTKKPEGMSAVGMVPLYAAPQRSEQE